MARTAPKSREGEDEGEVQVSRPVSFYLAVTEAQDHPTEEELDDMHTQFLNRKRWTLNHNGVPIGNLNAYKRERREQESLCPQRIHQRKITLTTSRLERKSLKIQSNLPRTSKSQSALDAEPVNDLAPAAPVSRQHELVEEDRLLTVVGKLPQRSSLPTVHEASSLNLFYSFVIHSTSGGAVQQLDQREARLIATGESSSFCFESSDQIVLEDLSNLQNEASAKTYKQYCADRQSQSSTSNHARKYHDSPHTLQKFISTVQNRGTSQGGPSGRAHQQRPPLYEESLGSTMQNKGVSQGSVPYSQAQQERALQYNGPPRSTVQNGDKTEDPKDTTVLTDENTILSI
ncbi:hypothetical protein B0H19DRAFT_1075545 [Mycena capillaripes]|nr:hypothetical protein B0H19DRAFT_1075545 [Mycena capillaripes]